MSDWSQQFLGRASELGLLQRQYDEAAAGQTRVVSLVAESGFGKTRLVQEFYRWLATQRQGDAAYWPDRLRRQEDNLLINPDDEACGAGGHLPFLWWGLRLSDPLARNEVVAGALWAGLDVLRPHLAAYQRGAEQQRLSSQWRGALAKSGLDLAIDVLGNFVTLGLLSTGKTALEKGRELYALHRTRTALDGRDVSPQAARQHANDELSASLIVDLGRLARQPPPGLAPVPLVLVIDDAQWLAQDAGLSAFLQALLLEARQQRWPLLLVLTCWEREWRESLAQGGKPAALADEAQGDAVVYLSRLPELDQVVGQALPGATAAQRSAILAWVDGNPRVLDELLLFLQRNRKFFEGRDPSCPLTVKGMAELAQKSLPDFVAERYAEAPPHVRQALGLASLHGMAFSPRAVRSMGERLGLAGVEEGLAQGMDPFGFSSLELRKGEGEFRLRAYRDAAQDDLGNHLDEDEAHEALQAACADILAQPEAASERDLALVLEALASAQALPAAVELLRRAEGRHDTRSAGQIGRMALPWLAERVADIEPDIAWRILDAVWEWQSADETLLDLAGRLLARARLAQAQDASADAEDFLIEALIRQATLAEQWEGPESARAWREELVLRCRERVARRDAPAHRRTLAYALVWLGNALESEGEGLPLIEEAVPLLRTLAQEEGTLRARQSLASVLDALGAALKTRRGPEAAQAPLQEALALNRALVAEEPTPLHASELIAALGHWGSLCDALEGPGSGRPWFEEQVALAQALAERAPTERIRKQLAYALSDLAWSVDAQEGQALARPLLEEALTLCRQRHAALATPDTGRDLIGALHALMLMLRTQEGGAAALPHLREALALSRELAQSPGAREDRRQLISLLLDLAWTEGLLEGLRQVQPYVEEAVALARAECVQGALAGRRQDGAAEALSQLADALQLLGRIAADRGDADAALTHFQEWVDVCRRLADLSDSPDPWLDLAAGLATLAGAMADPDDAWAVLEEAAAILRRLDGQGGTGGQLRRFQIRMARARLLQDAFARPQDAIADYSDAVAAARMLVMELGTWIQRSFLCTALSGLGGALRTVEGDRAARPALEEALALGRDLPADSLVDLAALLDAMGDVVSALDGPQAAQPYREEAAARRAADAIAAAAAGPAQAIRADPEAGTGPTA